MTNFPNTVEEIDKITEDLEDISRYIGDGKACKSVGKAIALLQVLKDIITDEN